MAATYVRVSGHHVAERVRPVSGTEDEKRLAALADDPDQPWQREDEPAASGPKQRARKAPPHSEDGDA